MSDTGRKTSSCSRRFFLSVSAASVAGSAASAGASAPAAKSAGSAVVRPPEGRRILLACKLTMITRKKGGKTLTLTERLRLAAEAGFDGVDFDEAGNYSPEQVRRAVEESGVFVHNAISHAHWKFRLTSPRREERDRGRANIEHCIRVSHAAGGSGVLIVVGHGNDGPEQVIEERCRAEIRRLIPLAAALGQRILIENVWNRMWYNHDGPPEQSPEKFIAFIDSLNSPWVGMYFDIGNHWKYGRPDQWIRAFGYRCVKLDVKGFSRKQNKFTDIGHGDLPWADVRKALEDIGYCGWATAEVGGGGLERLRIVYRQMKEALGV